MAPNRKSEQDPTHNSDSEEEEESEENVEQEGSESESESEEEDQTEDKTSTPTQFTKTPSNPKKLDASQAPAKPPPSSSSEDDEESESESDSPNPNIKPLASKPMESPQKSPKKPTSKTTSQTASRSTKRSVEDEKTEDAKDSKKAKKATTEDSTKKQASEDDNKKLLFQRLWSEDDEIAILKGMIDYSAKKGADPVADMNAFHEFIKKSLHVDVTKTQLSDKVRRLRKKYENNAGKEKKGKDRIFSKPHEQKAYDLSKKIWGGEGNGAAAENNVKANGAARKSQNQRATNAVATAVADSPKADLILSPNQTKEVTNTEIVQNVAPPRPVVIGRSIGTSGLEENIIKDGLELITGTKRKELEEKWKKLGVQEIELFLKRTDLIREQTKLLLDILKSSRN